MQKPGEMLAPAEPARVERAEQPKGEKDEKAEPGPQTIVDAQKSEYADLDANHITALAIKAKLLGGAFWPACCAF